MNFEKIRERIDYKGELKPTYEVLKALQKQFLLHVPFENLDIHMGIPLNYSYENVFKKIVEKNRGGVCYENNSLFYEILKNIGFQVNFICGEMFAGLPLKNDLDHMHMALIVRIEEELYLVDVGNGKSFGDPLPIINKAFSQGEDAEYIVDDFNDIKALYFKNSNGELTPRYVFDLFPKERKDFEQACIFIETSPESVFLKNTLASLYQEDGRVTLSGLNFISRKTEIPSTTEVSSKNAYGDLLKTYFDIALSNEELSRLNLKSSAIIM